MIKISDELKLAITQMPQAEKDKILLRLIAKDEKLVRQLQFELLEGEAKLVPRRLVIQKYIENSIVTYTGIDTPGWLLMCLRDCNARITEHTKATKDKFGQITLTLLMLNRSFAVFRNMLENMEKRADTFSSYVVKRTQDMLALIKKTSIQDQEKYSIAINKLIKNIYGYPPTKKLAEEVDLLANY